MEELKEQPVTWQQSFPWLRALVIAYVVCIVLSLVGVVLGAINFAAGPVTYPGIVLVLWLLVDILLFGAIFLHLLYYVVEVGRSGELGVPFSALYVVVVVVPILGSGMVLLVHKHFGFFSAGALVAFVLCSIIDAARITMHNNIEE